MKQAFASIHNLSPTASSERKANQSGWSAGVAACLCCGHIAINFSMAQQLSLHMMMIAANGIFVFISR